MALEVAPAARPRTRVQTPARLRPATA
jgi:hypothetical protein